MKKIIGQLMAVILVIASFSNIASAATESWKSKNVTLSDGGALYPTVDPVTGKTFLVSVTSGIYGRNSVSVLDQRNKIQTVIPVSGVPYYGTFSISPASGEFYVTMFQPQASTTIYAISTATNAVKQIAIGSEASNAAYDSDRNEMNILVKENGVWHLVALNANDSVTSDISIAPTYSTEMVYDPNNKSIDIVDGVAQKIYVVNATSRNITTLSVPRTGSPFYQGVLYNPSNHYVYVLNQNNTVSVIYGNSVIATITVPGGSVNLNRLGYSPANGDVYVSETYFGGFVYTIKDLAVTGTGINVGGNPTAFAYDPDDQNMYVVDLTGNIVTVISQTSSIVGVISLSPNIRPESAVYNPASKGIHVPVTSSNGLSTSDYIITPVISTKK